MLSLSFLITVSAQTVDEVLAEYFAVVGQEKLLTTNTFSTKGKIVQGQFEIPFTLQQKRPMNLRMDAEFQGMKISHVTDGKTGWSINPMMGSSDPQPMTEEEVDRMNIQADYDGMFYNYQEKGYKVELEGKEVVDDIETYVIKLTKPNGDVITSYIDAENYVILKSKSKIKVQGVDTDSEMIFSNYKYVNEILNPFSIETKMNGETVMQMVLEEVTYDVEVSDSSFIMPEVIAPTDSTGSQ